MNGGQRSIALVAWREISERLHGRAFMISSIAIVAVVLAGVILPALNDRTTRVQAGVTGATPPALAPPCATPPVPMTPGSSFAAIRPSRRGRAVRDGQVDVLIVADERLVWNTEPEADVAAVVTGAVQRVRFGERAAELGLTSAQVGTLVAPTTLPARVLEAADDEQEAREAIAFVSFIVLLMMTMVYGSAVAEGVAQEKGTRVMELLVCRVRPSDLLAGKVLGIGVVGLARCCSR
jgi:ABC-2 type transport system permease protein